MKKYAQALKYGSGAALVAASGMVNAAIPAAANTAFTDLIADVASMETLIWSLLVPVTLVFMVIKLFKRGTNKAV
jgi:hypothetical protein